MIMICVYTTAHAVVQLVSRRDLTTPTGWGIKISTTFYADSGVGTYAEKVENKQGIAHKCILRKDYPKL